MTALRARARGAGLDQPLILVIGGLAGVAWLALWAWGSSPSARYLDHAALAGAVGPLDRLLFVGGWTLMTIAMMLPTSLPLVATFVALTRRRPQRNLLVGLLVAGYLGTWIVVGAALHATDGLLHAVVAAIPALADHPQLVTAGILGSAGLYQFSPLKYRCLDACRSPLGFVLNHWVGRRPARESLEIGIRHGLFCVGCCWSLMLVMFAVGVGNLGWMLGLGILMTIEKNVRGGRRLGRPVGVILVLAAVWSLGGL